MSTPFALPRFAPAVFAPAVGLSLALGLGAVLLPLQAAPAFAQSTEAQSGDTQAQAPFETARITALTDTMMIGDVIGVMREEGLDYGRTLAAEMFPGSGGAQWDSAVDLIYDAQSMRSRFDTALGEALQASGADLSAIEAFFGSEQGQTVLRLEIEARRAMLDPAVEEAAKLAWADMEAEGGPRVEALMRFAQVNDLIESNVMGAMNSNFAFYRGLSESGAFPQEMTEEQMLADVWAQEPDVRAETTDWLFPFLSLAYQPLPDEGLEAYLAFSESPAGQQMNAALFAAFDKVFTQISYDLGRAAANQMLGQDI